jgi:hypothetical protein
MHAEEQEFNARNSKSFISLRNIQLCPNDWVRRHIGRNRLQRACFRSVWTAGFRRENRRSDFSQKEAGYRAMVAKQKK